MTTDTGQDFCSAHVTQGQSSQKEPIKALLLNLCAKLHLTQAKRERDAVLPRDLALQDMAAGFDGHSLTDQHKVHQFHYLYLTGFWKETLCAIARKQPESLCPPTGPRTVKQRTDKGTLTARLVLRLCSLPAGLC